MGVRRVEGAIPLSIPKFKQSPSRDLNGLCRLSFPAIVDRLSPPMRLVPPVFHAPSREITPSFLSLIHRSCNVVIPRSTGASRVSPR